MNTLEDRLREYKIHHRDIEPCFHDSVLVHSIRTKVLKDLLSIIGEDEDYGSVAALEGDTQARRSFRRNELRDELRQALTKYVEG